MRLNSLGTYMYAVMRVELLRDVCFTFGATQPAAAICDGSCDFVSHDALCARRLPGARAHRGHTLHDA